LKYRGTLKQRTRGGGFGWRHEEIGCVVEAEEMAEGMDIVVAQREIHQIKILGARVGHPYARIRATVYQFL
jgi:hypothetical protein